MKIAESDECFFRLVMPLPCMSLSVPPSHHAEVMEAQISFQDTGPFPD